MRSKYWLAMFIVSLCLMSMCLTVPSMAQAQTNQPAITDVSPNPVSAPTIPGQLFTGTFTITGTNLQGGNVTTNGPLSLVGTSRVNADGTSIQRDYQIGCCGPQNGQAFNLFVTTAGGQASISNSINLNFSEPATAPLKICKIAGPGIPIGTPFTFEVRGTAPSSPSSAAPGLQILRTVTVLAGPASDGGFCSFVRELDETTLTTFITDTPAAIVETGFAGSIPGVGPGKVRTANIRSTNGFTSVPSSVVGNSGLSTPMVPGGTVQLNTATGGNPDLEYGSANSATFTGSAAVVTVRTESVVEFTGFVYNPSYLKICKIAGAGVPVGTTFRFSVTVNTPMGLNGPLFDSRLTSLSLVTVPAGPASQGGFCQFVQGPLTPGPSTPPIGTFNAGSIVSVTELAATGISVTAITSMTGALSNVNIPLRSASLTISGVNGVNQISFTGSSSLPPPPIISTEPSSQQTAAKPASPTDVAMGGGTGIVSICAQASGPGLEDRIFTYRIGGLIVEVLTGKCSNPIELPTGMVMIEELTTGKLINGGTFSGRFRLMNVAASVPNSLGPVNLAARTAVAFVSEGGIYNQTEVTFTNTFAVTAAVSICKHSVSGDNVTGFFNFTIDAVPNQVFTAPVGGCTGTIMVNVPTIFGPPPAPATVRVTEFSRPGFELVSATTLQPDRLNAFALNLGVNSANGSVFLNPGGGYVDVDVIEGSPISETAVNFANRAPDTTPPVINAVVSGLMGSNGYYRSNVSVRWNIVETNSVITARSPECNSTIQINADTNGMTMTCSATSAGGTNTQSVTIKRDATKPTLTFGSASPAANAAGWHNSNVSFAYTANDTTSGVSSATPVGPLVLSAEGGAVTGTVTVTDNAGNTETFTSPAVKIDKTAPVLNGLTNNTVDSGAPIAVNFGVSVNDNFDSSPAVTCAPASGSIFALGLTNVTCNASDVAGNAAQTKVFQVYVLAPGNEATPTGEGVTVQSETGTQLTFENVASPGVTTVEPIADPASVGSVPGGFAISNTVAFQINTTAGLAEGSSVKIAFVVPESVILTPQQFDSLRILHGMRDADGNPVLDAEGNPVLEDVTEDNPPSTYTRNFNSRTIYAVTTSFSPFYLAQKVDYKVSPLFDQSRVRQIGSVIPVKLKLLDAAGITDLSSANTVLTVRGLTLLDGNTSVPVRSVGAANPENKFRFATDNKVGDHYIYNLNTRGLAPGKYAMSFYVGNDTSFFYTVNFEVR